VTGAFTAHVAASQLAELVLDERHQLIDGTVITASPGLAQRGSAQGLIWNDEILLLQAGSKPRQPAWVTSVR
jgi:hypothetical protein